MLFLKCRPPDIPRNINNITPENKTSQNKCNIIAIINATQNFDSSFKITSIP